MYRYTPARAGTGATDHIAFAEQSQAAARQALAAAGSSFREVMVPRDNDVQLFVHDPDGVRIELNFEPPESVTSVASGLYCYQYMYRLRPPHDHCGWLAQR